MTRRRGLPALRTRVRGGAASPQVRLERRAGRVRRRRLAVTLFVAALLAVVGATVWLFGFSSVLEVQQTRVEGLGEADTDTVLAAAAVPTGMPLARVDTATIGRRVEQVPFVRQVSVSRGWPHTVVVEVQARVPVLALKAQPGALHLVDDQGTSFREVTEAPAGLPVVDAGSGSATAAGLRAVVEMLAAFSEGQRAQVGDIRVAPDDQVTFTLGPVRVIWGLAGRAERKVAVINALMKTSPAVIDVSVPDSPVTR